MPLFDVYGEQSNMPCKFGSAENPCQFNVPEQDLVGIEGGTKVCVFHLPAGNAMGIPDSRRPKQVWTQTAIDEFNQQILEIIQNHIANETAVNLEGVIFPGKFSFDGFSDRQAVLRRASFHRCSFRGQVNFDNLHFSTCRFDSATFEADASFRNTVFEQGCEFGNANFTGYADFSDSRFSGNAVFTNSVFLRGASWENATFSGAFIFHCTNDGVPIIADFSGCRFDGSVNFRNRQLKSDSSFTHAIFGGLPNFFDCSIHSSIDFSTAKFKYTGADARLAYAELRRKMEDRRDRVQQGIFHALEKRCERRTLPRFSFDRFVSWLYGATSAYGTRIVRPLVWLAGLTLFSAGVYAKLFHAADSELVAILWRDDWAHFISTVFSFSLQQVLHPFTIWAGKYEAIDSIIGVALTEYPLVLRLTAAMQSLLAFGLIAVFLISIRWRYRRG